MNQRFDQVNRELAHHRERMAKLEGFLAAATATRPGAYSASREEQSAYNPFPERR